ncbi:MAG: hypothetical protein MJ165_04485 [Alphaproteobacteria bacterium]|nr:hypothetical protein [Alphaproteobacteria bacterium]
MSEKMSDKKVELIMFLIIGTIVTTATIALNYGNSHSNKRPTFKPKQEIKKDTTKISQVKDTIQMVNVDVLNGRNGR